MQVLGFVSGENWKPAASSPCPHGTSPLGFHRERALWHLFLSHEDASYAVLESPCIMLFIFNHLPQGPKFRYSLTGFRTSTVEFRGDISPSMKTVLQPLLS